eukprot:NODE_2515_length_1099_cov_13.685714_g1815_i1.p1 GENE.NODE_2515_length_1099_cov_13.685714_g1815_i1~~NODE_2515_length_1099_cov_13.685714_g1815_i1.p1  ORF type:complete len:360 (+),score=18.86 NODE_2515_length_1099_cov_13.685714_g1815_i1:124-1080(+)
MSHAVQTQRHVYIGMEMCRGSLFDRIVEAGRLDEDEARAYWIQLLHAVQYLHDQEVCHLDLKPENVLFSVDEADSDSDDEGEEDYVLHRPRKLSRQLQRIISVPPDKARGGSVVKQIKIIDFGLSVPQSKGTRTRSVCGTPNYVAPEIIDDNVSDYDATKADIWSLGCILFAMTAGRLPFFAKEMKETFERIKQVEFQQSRRCSPQLRSLINLIFVADPEKRPSIQALLDHPWTRGFDLLRRHSEPSCRPETYASPRKSSTLSLPNPDDLQESPAGRGHLVHDVAFSSLPEQQLPRLAMSPPRMKEPMTCTPPSLPFL